MEWTRFTPRQLDLAEDLFVRKIIDGGDYLETLREFLFSLMACGINMTQEELQSFVMATGQEIEKIQLKEMGLETIERFK